MHNLIKWKILWIKQLYIVTKNKQKKLINQNFLVQVLEKCQYRICVSDVQIQVKYYND